MKSVIKMSPLRNVSPRLKGNVRDRLRDTILDEPLEQRGHVTRGEIVPSETHSGFKDHRITPDHVSRKKNTVRTIIKKLGKSKYST